MWGIAGGPHQKCTLGVLVHYVMNAKALSIMRYLDDINTEHNIKSVCRAAVAQWTKRLTRTGQTRVPIILERRKYTIILLLHNKFKIDNTL